MGTYSRSAVFAARFTFAPVEPPAELDARLARNPPSLSPDEWERPVTITYPLPSLCQRPARKLRDIVSLLIQDI